MKKWQTIVIFGGIVGLALVALFDVFWILQQPYLQELLSQFGDPIRYPAAPRTYAQIVSNFALLNMLLKFYLIAIGIFALLSWHRELQQ